MKTLAEHRKLLCPFRFNKPNPECLGDACAALLLEENETRSVSLYCYTDPDSKDNAEVGNAKARLADAGYSNFVVTRETSGRVPTYVKIEGRKDKELCNVSCGALIPRLVNE